MALPTHQEVVKHMEWLVHHETDAILAALGWPEDFICSLHLVHTSTGWWLRLGEHRHLLGGKARTAARVLEGLAVVPS